VISHPARRASRDAFLSLRLLIALTLGSIGLQLALSAVNVGGASAPRLFLGAAHDGVAPPKIAPWVMDHTANGQRAEFLVVLADHADLTEARAARSKHERRRQVRDALWNKAGESQRPILQWLRQHQIEHRSFYIVNAIWVKSDAQTAAILAARPDVSRVEGNPEIQNRVLDPVLTGTSPSAPESTTAIEPGISYSHAPEVWSLGYTGQGIVVGGADTGYRWTHAVLKNHYRGWDGVSASHDYNWHDSIHSGGGTCGHDSLTPCDDSNHGTHTMGTAVGSDGGNNQTGMAPGAKWIGCRNMDGGVGTPARYIECMEFFLAPYPVGATTAQGDPDKAPDISTNSWGCPDTEGCSANTLQAAVEAQRAAGIFMVVAAGNAGPGCNTVQDPPAIYDAVYSIGALNNGSDTIASFSSNGPVTIDNSMRIKPDLSAPGTAVRSSTAVSNTSYATFQGTSMATPHVAGAAALLWSAAPLLRNDIAGTEKILNESAVPIVSAQCDTAGTSVPNNTYGHGRLDVKAAVDYALLRTTAVTADSGGVTVTFYAGANRRYRLEYKSGLTEMDWLPVPGIADRYPSVDGDADLTDPYASQQDQRFYRVELIH
jgi:serine protease AprX